MNARIVDPSGHRLIGGHHFHAGCPSVRPYVRHKSRNALHDNVGVREKENTHYDGHLA